MFTLAPLRQLLRRAMIPKNRSKGLDMPAADAPQNKLIVFTVGQGSYAIDVAAVAEIASGEGIVPQRGAPGGVIGVVTVRDRVTPVFDLHWKFDLPQPLYWEGQRLLFIETHAGPLALMVDAVEEVATVSGDALQAFDAAGSNRRLGYLQGVLRIGQRIVLWVDPALLVPGGISEAALRVA
ncbi:hypothetical protein AYO38_07625 [bacterium SCGC AG-212-C10]|nr:hypothetical protein AYO38_07625 [bacterium SCGC AG-212-C10]